jgi:Flp pilus assembly protein TadG
MHGLHKSTQAGQAVVLVAISALVLTAILALAIDGGGIYLDRRQLQNAADAGALAGAELLLTSNPPNYAAMHTQALATVVKNLPGTSAGGISASNSPNGGSPWTIGPYTITVQATTYRYQVTVQHVHAVAVAPVHGFASTITLQVQATAQNMNLPYAVVLLQDQYDQWANFSINGTPGSITFQGPGGSNPNDRGGMFSNESIEPGNGVPSIIFGPAAGDLWAVNESNSDNTALNQPGVVTGSQVNSAPNLPFNAAHLDFPNYPEPAAPAVTWPGRTVVSGLDYLCPGQYTNAIKVQNGATAIMLPGVYEILANGADIQGTLRTLTNAELPITQCGTTVAVGADLGVIIEVTPANVSGTTTCNKHIFSAAATSVIDLTPSPKYFNISIYIEPMPNWQTVCSNAPLGTNVLKFSGGSCYSIRGAVYGPADNMTMTGSACGSGVGQIVAWTLTINGNGNVNETYDPSKLPYIKGLIQ